MTDRETLRAGAIARFEAGARTAALATFDVFDTLVSRVCDPATPIERASSALAGALRLSPAEAIAARAAAERALRAGRATGDGEYELEELLASLLDSRGAPCAAAAAELSALEAAIEVGSVFPNPDVVAAARRLSRAGVRLAAVSDMYLSHAQVCAILDRCGLSALFPPESTFVSSTIGANKASGRLFSIVSERTGVPLARIRHLGDNPGVDIAGARRAGVAATLLPRTAEDERDALWRGRADPSTAAAAAHAAGCLGLRGGSAIDRAASLVAPVICHFVDDIARRAARDGVDSVWFLSREGFLLKRLYDAIAPEGAPPSGYLAVSRRTVFAASCERYDLRTAFLSEWNGEGRSVEAMLVSLALPKAEIDRLAVRHGFDGGADAIRGWGDPRFHRLASDGEVGRRLAEVGASAREDLRRYLERSGFLGRGSVAVADVGWAGQIQEGLELALSAMGVAVPEVRGYYLAVRGLGTLRRRAGVAIEGVLHDASEPDWAAASPLLAVDVFEDACRAPHGSVEGYRDGAPSCVPADRPSRRAEMAADPALAALQDGVLRYAARWAAARDLLPGADMRGLAAIAAATASRFPDRATAAFFESFAHSLNFGSDRLVERDSRRGLAATARRVVRSRWREGSAAAAGRAVQAALLAVRMARRPEPALADPRPAAAGAAPRPAPVAPCGLFNGAMVAHADLLREAAPDLGRAPLWSPLEGTTRILLLADRLLAPARQGRSASLSGWPLRLRIVRPGPLARLAALARRLA